MLAYSGRGDSIIQPINFTTLIHEMHPLLEVSVAKHVMLRFNLDESLPQCDADITQIQQIVMNLIINASEAIGSTVGQIAIATGTMSVDTGYLSHSIHQTDVEPDHFVYLEVSDNGCGMDEKTRKKSSIRFSLQNSPDADSA